jgi:tRNA-dihydrouridine synthase
MKTLYFCFFAKLSYKSHLSSNTLNYILQQLPIIYLAPFQGITGVTFRLVYAKHFQGVDKFFTPFFTTIHHSSKLPPRKLAELGHPYENGIPVVPQILSKDADEIIRFANFCERLGFDELNWNLGCPYPQVANKKRGSGMLPFPVMVEDILGKVMNEINIKFSIKCRLGYVSADEIFDLVPIFNHYPISGLTIHARTGKQLYTGKTDLETFEKLIPLISPPLTYNGDIFFRKDFECFDKQFNTINSFMIGRGLLWDPFLPAKIKDLTIVDNQQEHIRQFINDLYFAYRKQMNDNLSAISVLKEYWSYLSMSFNDPHKVFKKLKKVNRFDEYEDAVSLVFDEFNWVGA